MAKNCPYCQTELPDDAAFCYGCGKPQPITEEAPPKKTPRWVIPLLLLLAALTFFAVWQMSKPQSFLGTYELDYTAEDGQAYHLTLSFSSPEDACDTISHPGGTPVNTYLYITDANGGNALSAFVNLVDAVDVHALPTGGAKAAELSESGHDERVWNCVAYNDSTTGANIIRWTLDMQNGDKLIVSHKVDYTK